MDTYPATISQLQADLYAPPLTEFPLQVTLADRTYSFPIWHGEQLPDTLLAVDTETELIIDREVPPMALGAICGDRGSCCFIHPDRIPQFVLQHHRACWVAHNAVFDFWVIAQQLQAHPSALAAWWDMAGDGRLCCTMLLDALIRLARDDTEPINRDLGKVAADYCSLPINKMDPYRLRYGELIDLPESFWPRIEPGFWQYAAKDPIATLQIAQQQIKIAHSLIRPHAGELLTNALRRFGPLTASLQVQGAIALEYLSRAGIRIDLSQTKQLQGDIATRVAQHMQELERLGGEQTFRRYGPRSKQAGQYQVSESGVPKRNAKLIKGQLEHIAKSSELPIRPPRNKDELVTDSVKYWKQHQDLDPYIAAYVQFSEQAKLSQFFARLDSEQIYPRYRPLVRTGRTSCSAPNLQQLPRDARFREVIIAPQGYQLLQIDYSVLELRTLAQICLRRYGHSVLANLFRTGVDPHCYTAALLLGISLDQFQQLLPAEQKQARQRAKAINFGVPGGLGAASLVSYAKQAYGIVLTIEQAKAFRYKLTDRIYPELRAYLKDVQRADIANNLHTSEGQVRCRFGSREQILHASRIIGGCEDTPEGEVYGADLVAYVWHSVEQLNRNPALRQAIASRQGSTLLMRKVFFGHAVTISGRVRGHVGFSQAANTPFQGLAADGNKLALFQLLRAGFQVCGFIHDEMLILIPDGTDYDTAIQQVQHILASAMQQVCPDIPICTEFLLADRWYKGVDQQPTDSRGKIVPYCKE